MFRSTAVFLNLFILFPLLAISGATAAENPTVVIHFESPLTLNSTRLWIIKNPVVENLLKERHPNLEEGMFAIGLEGIAVYPDDSLILHIDRITKEGEAVWSFLKKFESLAAYNKVVSSDLRVSRKTLESLRKTRAHNSVPGHPNIRHFDLILETNRIRRLRPTKMDSEIRRWELGILNPKWVSLGPATCGDLLRTPGSLTSSDAALIDYLEDN